MNRNTCIKVIVAFLVIATSFTMRASAQEKPIPSGLAYDAHTQSPVPIPPSERALQTAQAQSWSKVSDQGVILEGAIFTGGQSSFPPLPRWNGLWGLTPDAHLLAFRLLLQPIELPIIRGVLHVVPSQPAFDERLTHRFSADRFDVGDPTTIAVLGL